MQSRIVFFKSLSGSLAGPRRECAISDTLLGDLVSSLETVESTPKAHTPVT